MKKIIPILIVILIAVYGCGKAPIEKPENLLPEDQLIDMMVDVHIAEATYNTRRNQDTLLLNSNSADFYYSVLQKHGVPDSVFEKSIVYYGSQPRRFEKMYRKVMNQLTELEQEYSGRSEQLEELEIQKRSQ